MIEIFDHKVAVSFDKVEYDRVRKYVTVKANKTVLDRIYREKI